VSVIGDILQPTHLIFVLVVALLVLGPKRLPEVGRSLGKGLRDFKSALSGDERIFPDEVPSQTSNGSTTPAAEPAEQTPAEHKSADQLTHSEQGVGH
jgi:sec-independent protein translocase protein TatA